MGKGAFLMDQAMTNSQLRLERLSALLERLHTEHRPSSEFCEIACPFEWKCLEAEHRRFCYLSESVATLHPVTDQGEALVPLEKAFDAAGEAFEIGPPPQGGDGRHLLRASAAARLIHAAKLLRILSAGALRLRIHDTYRSLETQERHFNAVCASLAARHRLAADELWELATRYVADPRRCPPHCTGGAVDLAIVHTATGAPLEMGTDIFAIGPHAHTWTAGIEDKAAHHRLLLYHVMARAGFVNLPTEWWHFSYGDQYWAMYHGHASACYGVIRAAAGQDKAAA